MVLTGTTAVVWQKRPQTGACFLFEFTTFYIQSPLEDDATKSRITLSLLEEFSVLPSFLLAFRVIKFVSISEDSNRRHFANYNC